MFFTDQAETFGWATYKDYITRFAGDTAWEGTLRHNTGTPGRVILGLEERNTRVGFTHVSSTVTIYEFGEDEKLRHPRRLRDELEPAAGHLEPLHLC